MKRTVCNEPRTRHGSYRAEDGDDVLRMFHGEQVFHRVLHLLHHESCAAPHVMLSPAGRAVLTDPSGSAAAWAAAAWCGCGASLRSSLPGSRYQSVRSHSLVANPLRPGRSCLLSTNTSSLHVQQC